MSADNEQPQQVNGTAADAAEGKNAEASQTWATMSRWEKYRYLLGHITVEPVLFCYIFPAVLYSLAISNLNLEKACRVNLAYNDTVCDALMERDTDGLEEQDQNVNSLVSQMNIWMVPLQNATPALLILFLGSWSDRRARRKPCIVAPIIGQVITCIGLGLCWFFYYEWPLEAAGVIESLFSSITGGGMVIFMGTMSYVSDVTTPEERTFRLGVINLLLTITSPIANTLSGTLLKPLGYLGIFALTGLIFLAGFLYGALGLKESRPTVPRPADVGFLCDLFNPRSLLDTLVVLTKKRENSRRSRLVLVILVNVLIMGPGRGEDVLSYLYVRERFKWTEVDYSYFTTFGIIINLVGTVLATGVLSRGLGISDSLICLICCVCHVVANFMYAFATVSWVFYLGQVVDIMIGSTLIVARSLSSKLVPPEDFGKVNSLIGLFSALAQVIYMPIFNLFYQYTLTFMSGAFYLLGAALLLPPIGIFLWLYSFERKEAKEEEKATVNEKFQYTTSARYRTGPMVNEAFEDDKL